MQVCFRLTYYQGRAGLIGVDAVVGHSQASLGPSQDKPVKKSKTKTSKRKLSTPKGAQPAAAQLAGQADSTCKLPTCLTQYKCSVDICFVSMAD